MRAPAEVGMVEGTSRRGLAAPAALVTLAVAFDLFATWWSISLGSYVEPTVVTLVVAVVCALVVTEVFRYLAPVPPRVARRARFAIVGVGVVAAAASFTGVVPRARLATDIPVWTALANSAKQHPNAHCGAPGSGTQTLSVPGMGEIDAICVLSTGAVRFARFAPGHEAGVIYDANGDGSTLADDDCAAHIAGDFWQYFGGAVDCPFGFTSEPGG
jgi:hypothetical protein